MKAVLFFDGTHVTDATGNPLREALAQFQARGWDAQTLVDKPIVAHWVYRLVGKRRRNTQAKRHGSEELLKYSPYQALKVTR